MMQNQDNQENNQNCQGQLFEGAYCDTHTKNTSQFHQKHRIIINAKNAISESFRNILTAGIQYKKRFFKEMLELMQSFSLNVVQMASLQFLLNGKNQNMLEIICQSILLNRSSTYDEELHCYLSQCLKLLLTQNGQIVNALKTINSFIVKNYYDNQLSEIVLQVAIDLNDKLYTKALQKNEVQPQNFMYFLNCRDQIKVLLANSKWLFSKGMGIYFHIYVEKQQQFIKEGLLFSMMTIDQKKIQLKIINGSEIYFQTSKNQKILDTALLAIIQYNKWISIALELEISGGFSFGGYDYQLNLKIDDLTHKNINVHIPKFTSSDIVTELIFMKGFIGRCTSIIQTITPDKDLANLKYPKGITHQNQIQEILNNIDNKLILYTSIRTYKDILVNCINSENSGAFSGKIKVTRNCNILLLRGFDNLMPYFYFTKFIKEGKRIMNKLIRFLFRLMNFTESRLMNKKCWLMVGYMIISSGYTNIDAQTLEILYEFKQSEDHKAAIELMLQNFNLQKVTEKNIFKATNFAQILTIMRLPSEEYLNSFKNEWKRLWTKLQSFGGFWNHPSFQYQINEEFSNEIYKYKKQKEMIYNWTIRNLITKQFCRPLLKPYFTEPQFAIKKNSEFEFVETEVRSGDFDGLINSTWISQKFQKAVMMNIKIPKTSLRKVFLKELLKNQEEKKPWTQFKVACLYIVHLYVIQGFLSVQSDGILKFESQHEEKKYDHMCICGWKNRDKLILKWKQNDIKKIKKRRFNMSKQSIEIFLKDGSTEVFHLLEPKINTLIQSFGSTRIFQNPLEQFTSSKMPADWIDQKISNFYYLMWLNFVGGRSYQDLSQYPVLPWILISFGENIENTPEGYRDLTKNMGALGTQQKKKQIWEKYNSKNQYELLSYYHYGTHYSSSAIICNFLIRVKPYSDGAKTLQSGKFDVADRVFSHYQDSWNNVMNSASDVRELIPQFFVLPEMFLNINNYDYGLTQNKDRIDNVKLPKWANNNPYIFIVQNRKAFQNDIVSKNLTGWIDLIFGLKQRGKIAIENMNIFYPFTYEDSIQLQNVQDLETKVSFQTQIAHFGQTPSQILPSNSHPARGQSTSKAFLRLLSDGNDMRIYRANCQGIKNKEIRIFDSNLEYSNSILKIKFLLSNNNNQFIVFRKKDISLYNMKKDPKKKSEITISLEKKYNLEIQSTQLRLDIKNVWGDLPVQHFNNGVFFIGGYHGGYMQIIYWEQNYKQIRVKVTDQTITALGSDNTSLFIGTSVGQLYIFSIENQTSLKLKHQKHDHLAKINDIYISSSLRMFCTCSDDSTIFLYNMYSYITLRVFHNPKSSPIGFVRLSSAPLFCVIFSSKEENKIYTYSINGQFLAEKHQQNGIISNPRIARSSLHFDHLIYVNENRCVQIKELPFLQEKRKIQLKKGQGRVSHAQLSPDARTIIFGTNQGEMCIVTNPESF